MAVGPDLEAQVRDLEARMRRGALELKANPDPASLDHVRAAVMESFAAELRDLLNITSTGEDIDHDAAAERAVAEGLIPPPGPAAEFGVTYPEEGMS